VLFLRRPENRNSSAGHAFQLFQRLAQDSAKHAMTDMHAIASVPIQGGRAPDDKVMHGRAERRPRMLVQAQTLTNRQNIKPVLSKPVRCGLP
jgi:hypothetical protein